MFRNLTCECAFVRVEATQGPEQQSRSCVLHLPAPHFYWHSRAHCPISVHATALSVSFQEDQVECHPQTGQRHGKVQSRPNDRSFVKDSPHPLLLRQKPAIQTRDLLQVRTRANEQKPKHKDSVEGVHVSHGGSALFLCSTFKEAEFEALAALYSPPIISLHSSPR